MPEKYIHACGHSSTYLHALSEGFTDSLKLFLGSHFRSMGPTLGTSEKEHGP